MILFEDNMQNSRVKPLISLIGSMLIFGTIGIFRKYIPLSSALLACARGFIGGLFLLFFVSLKKKKVFSVFSAKQIILFCITGVFLGTNWILLFEAYNHTTVAVATLCYYMEPTIVILLSPLFFGERLTLKKSVCAAVSIIGIALVSGITGFSGVGTADITGILCGLGAALLYSAVVILNKKNPSENAYGKTIIQLLSAAVVLLPYILLTENIKGTSVDAKAIVMVLTVGILHTGIAYALYFGSINSLNSQTVAIMSYIDPVSAIILSALFLNEKMTVFSAIGAVLIIGAAIISETEFDKLHKKEKTQ